MSDYRLSRPAHLTCPECHGTMVAEDTGPIVRFCCHIGHRFGLNALLPAQFRRIETLLETALAILVERAELCRRMRQGAPPEAARALENAETESIERAEALRAMLEASWSRPENVRPLHGRAQ